MTLDNKQIKVIGDFLLNYENDLINIIRFKEIIDNYKKLRNSKITKNELNWFKDFLKEYKVIRNINAGKAENVLLYSLKYISANRINNVNPNQLAVLIKKYTHNKNCVSLASKILYLYKPEKFIPLDSLNRSFFGQKNLDYSEFNKNFTNFYLQESSKQKIQEIYLFIESIAIIIEMFQNFNGHNKLIRMNRIKDKLLRIYVRNGVELKNFK
jgi:hypothetical protein